MDEIKEEMVVNVHGQTGSACAVLSKNPEKKILLEGTGTRLRVKLKWI